MKSISNMIQSHLFLYFLKILKFLERLQMSLPCVRFKFSNDIKMARDRGLDRKITPFFAKSRETRISNSMQPRTSYFLATQNREL